MKLRLLRWAKAMLRVGDIQLAVRPGVVMELDESDFVQREILFRGAYEPRSLALCERLLAEARVFVDIGAHVGQHALMAAARLAGRGDVFAFEPAPRNAARLLRNIELSGLANLHVFTFGISEHAGLAHMTQPHELNWGGTHIAAERTPGGHTVTTMPLVEVARFAGWTDIDLVKIDVEGHEMSVLRSLFAPGVPRPRHLVMEFKPSWFDYGGPANALPDLLRHHHYILRDVAGDPFDSTRPLIEDNIWAARE